MPTLNWIGKEKVVNHHLEVPYRVLEHRFGFRADNAEDKSATNSGNMIIHGDNLEALKALIPEYEGKVKCIYIDPPYNTGNEGWVYNDNVNDPKIQKWLHDIYHDTGVTADDLTRHDKWLCMMYPRLKLLQRLLSEDGAIFISIDDNEQANLKLICDEIFGVRNFVGTFTWKCRAKPSNTGMAKYKPQNDSEFVFCYKGYGNPQFISVSSGRERNYPHTDKEGNYRLQTILKSNRGENKRETMTFSLGDYTPPPTKRWQAGEETIKDLYVRNRITFETGEPMLKYYQHEEKEEVAPFWCHLPSEVSGTAEIGKSVLNKILGNTHGFDTVKPVSLIEYLLIHTMPKEGIVLDSFAGSGTTAHAVLNLNKKDGGNRKFILVEMEDYADTITAERVRKVMNGYADTEGTGGSFDYFELGKTLFNADGTLNESVGENRIREYVYYTETKQHLSRKRDERNPYLLDTWNGMGYYLYYEPSHETALTYDKLSIIREKAERYIVYADTCTIDKDYLTEKNIIFRKIPRDIQKF